MTKNTIKLKYSQPPKKCVVSTFKPQIDVVRFSVCTFCCRLFFIALFRNPFDGLRFWNMQHNVSSHICCSSSKCMRWNGVGEIMIEFTKKSHRPFSFSILHSAISIIVSKFQATFILFFPWHTEKGGEGDFFLFLTHVPHRPNEFHVESNWIKYEKFR